LINIILADDHKVVRKGLKALLVTEPDFNIVGEVENGLETVNMVEKLKPDILVLDMMMPILNGLEVISFLRAREATTGIVVLSMQNCETYIRRALRFGAKAYVLKEAAPEELVTAIREVKAGRHFLCSALAGKDLIQNQSPKDDMLNKPYLELTAREKEVMILAANGFTSNDIGDKLCLNISTVESHRANLMQKLNLHNHAQLVQYAMRIGLITPELEHQKT
jgi:DNA-binding NarL/FixJ family response regulator